MSIHQVTHGLHKREWVSRYTAGTSHSPEVMLDRVQRRCEETKKRQQLTACIRDDAALLVLVTANIRRVNKYFLRKKRKGENRGNCQQAKGAPKMSQVVTTEHKMTALERQVNGQSKSRGKYIDYGHDISCSPSPPKKPNSNRHRFRVLTRHVNSKAQLLEESVEDGELGSTGVPHT